MARQLGDINKRLVISFKALGMAALIVCLPTVVLGQVQETAELQETAKPLQVNNDVNQVQDPATLEPRDKDRPFDSFKLQDPKMLPPAADQQALREIEGIRAQLGGGISSRLFDSQEDRAKAEGMFRQHLRELAANRDSEPLVEQGERLPIAAGSASQAKGVESLIAEESQPFQGQSGGRSGNPNLLPSRSLETRANSTSAFGGLLHPLNRPKSLPRHDPVTELRSSAQNLEQMAAKFEALELYEEADQLRELSQKFWEAARDNQK